MVKLELPDDCQNYENIIDACCNNMQVNSQYKLKIIQNKIDLIRISHSYTKWARINFLFKYRNFKLNNSDLIRIGNRQITNLLTNEEMVKLYDNYFSKKGKSARKYYEIIINNAKNPNILCPFCGGIGEPNELDHFLPKSDFGYYSIFPYNLIPICKDCNQKYKGNFYPTEKNNQLIHPYLDDDCFFNKQWLFAKIIIDFDDVTLSTVRFCVNPPNDWSDDKKGKVGFHFTKFNLGERYAKKSVGELSQVINQMSSFKKNKSHKDDVLECLIVSVINNQRMNNWKRALYEAIQQEFNNLWSLQSTR